MPIPKPRSGESESEFMSRCIPILVGEGTDQEQAIAICATQWDDMKTIPEFKTKKELFAFLRENKDVLIAQKKATIKHTDTFSYTVKPINKDGNTVKANESFTPDSNEFKVRIIINTTNLLDSHRDVHFPELWKKSLSENKMIMHLQEHIMGFDKIISDGKDLNAYTKYYTWKELGYNYDGKTQALVFDSIIKRKRNPFMFQQYADGFVKNHSVGMQYVKIILAINDEDEGAEYEAWEKYFPEIANKEDAEKSGFFWAIKEAKVIEGSAVPLGSNFATPTLDNNLKDEPLEDTHQKIEPSSDTRIDYKYLINEFKKNTNG